MIEYFDSHAHFNDEKFDVDRDKIINDMYNFGVTKIISAGYNLESSKLGIEIANKYEYIYTTVGISPNDLSPNWEEDVENLDAILSNKNTKILAVGEIGLDYHYDIDREIQKRAFIKQIKLANKFNLPIVIHTREAIMDTLEILKDYPANKKGVFHCCPFNRELVKEGLKLGFMISFSGTVTFKNANNAKEITEMVPIDRMLVETDSPYLSPEPKRGSRNDSRNLEFIVKKIANYKNTCSEEIAKATYKNACNFFEI